MKPGCDMNRCMRIVWAVLGLALGTLWAAPPLSLGMAPATNAAAEISPASPSQSEVKPRAADDFDAQHRQALARNPPGVSLRLRVRGDKTT